MSDATGRIAAIDSLRAAAVLSVVAYHLDAAYLPGGFAGVDVFFLISGYVVTRALAAHGRERLHVFITGFYARRIRRILPALLVCLLVTGAMDSLFIPQAWLSSQNFDTGKYAFFGLSNVFLATHQESYFSPRIEFNPYAHTWSLGVEEQFYVLLPFLFFVTFRSAARRRCDARWLIPVVCAVSLAISAFLSLRGSPSAYYGLVSRFWELGAGAVLAEQHRRLGRSLAPAWLPNRLAIGAAITLLAIGFYASNAYAFPFPMALPAVAGSALLIDQSAFGRTRFRMLQAVPIVYIGTISYSIYLWHWPVFSLFRWTVGLDDWEHRLVALAVVSVLAMASYHLVERPFQRRSRRFRNPYGAIAGGLLALVIAFFAARGLHNAQPTLSLSVTRDRSVWYSLDRSSRPLAAGCHSTKRTDRFAQGRIVQLERVDCEPPGERRTLFVAGDSHVDAYMSMLGRFVAEQPFRVLAYVKEGCPFFSLRSIASEGPNGCEDFVRTSIADMERRARPGDLLFLPSLRMERTADQWGRLGAVETDPNPPRPADRHAVTAAVAETEADLEGLDRLGVTIVFEAPKPIYGAPAFRCADWFDRSNPVCRPGFEKAAATLQEQRRPVLEGMQLVQDRLRHVHIWDPFPVLCPGEVCNAFDGRTPLFFDGDHLSGAGNAKLYPNFVAFIKSVESSKADRGRADAKGSEP